MKTALLFLAITSACISCKKQEVAQKPVTGINYHRDIFLKKSNTDLVVNYSTADEMIVTATIAAHATELGLTEKSSSGSFSFDLPVGLDDQKIIGTYPVHTISVPSAKTEAAYLFTNSTVTVMLPANFYHGSGTVNITDYNPADSMMSGNFQLTLHDTPNPLLTAILALKNPDDASDVYITGNFQNVRFKK